MILFIEETKPEFTIYLDPPAHNPKTISLNCAHIRIPDKLEFPPDEVHIYCDLVDSEDVRLNSKRTQLLGMIHRKRANEMSIINFNSKIKTNGVNRVYSIFFRVTDGKMLFPTDKIRMEIEIS